MAIKELLMRSAPALDEWTVAGITGSLKIPREWIDEAKVRNLHLLPISITDNSITFPGLTCIVRR